MYWILVSWILCQGLLKFTCAPLYLPWPTTLPTTRTTDNRSSSSSAPLVRPSLVCMSSLSCCVPCTCLPIYSTCLRLPVAFAQQSSLLLLLPNLRPFRPYLHTPSASSKVLDGWFSWLVSGPTFRSRHFTRAAQHEGGLLHFSCSAILGGFLW